MVHHEKNTSQSSSDQTNQILRLLLNKVDAIEDFLIKINVKLDNNDVHRNDRRNGRLSNGNQPTEIDISELKTFGLPAESASDIEKLDENLKIEDFKKNLVNVIGYWQFNLERIYS